MKDFIFANLNARKIKCKISKCKNINLNFQLLKPNQVEVKGNLKSNWLKSCYLEG